MAGQDAGAPPFDMGALSEVLNDDSIRQLAQQLSTDDNFMALQQQFAQMFAGGGGMPPGMMPGMMPGGMPPGMAGMMPPGLAGMMPPGMVPPGAAGAASQDKSAAAGGEAKEGEAAAPAAAGEGGASGPGEAGFDYSQYMGQMQGLLQNPAFMEMAEKLGRSLIENDPHMKGMFSMMSDPKFKEQMEAKVAELKDDPELQPIVKELEAQGPMALGKYWDNPKILQKFATLFQDVEGFPSELTAAAAQAGEDDGEEYEAEEVNFEGLPLLQAASDGNAEELKKLLESGDAQADQADDQNRTALHFSAGYGEDECVKILLKYVKELNAMDSNHNTALHYAAGYGQLSCCKMLLDAGADVSAKNSDDKIAQEVASMNAQTDVVELLKNHGK